MYKLKRRIKKIWKKIKNWVVTLLSFHMVSRGFTAAEAKRWVREVYSSCFRHRTYTAEQARWAWKHGFLPGQVERLGITEENVGEMISAKEYAYLRPLNGIYRKWLADIVSIHTIFKPYRNVMPVCYYQVGKRDGSTQIIPLYDRNAGDQMSDVFQLLREKKLLRVKTVYHRKSHTIAYRDGEYYFKGRAIEEEVLAQKLDSYGDVYVIMEETAVAEAFAGSRVRLIIFNEHGDDPQIGDAYIRFKKSKVDVLAQESEQPGQQIDGESDESIGAEDWEESGTAEEEKADRALFYCVDKKNGRLSLAPACGGMEEINPTTGGAIPTAIPCWDEIERVVDSLCRFAPQLEFFGMDIVITDDGFRILRMLNHPGYPSRISFSPETTAYLKRKVEQKRRAFTPEIRRANAVKRLRLGVRARFSRLFFPKAILPYISTRWMQDLWKDFRTNKDTTLGEKLWAARHGFISYRLHQYGITKENWKNYISDFEYKWLRHINNRYRHWMEDKITVKYVCSEYNSCFPEYYYHISLKNGNNRVLPMMDCPKGYSATYEDIFRLAREKGVLALKPDEGSHGNGFFKLSYEDGTYYLNHQEASEQDVLDILQNVKNQYLVTEYINMHPEIKRIYDGAVNTIRMIVFKKDGKNPVIGNAYMRFGSKRTGAVDNMGAGGMYAKVDVETGRFYDAKIIEANEIKSCLYHPDTNVKIEGYLPNWEKVKQDVLDVARSIPQLEYFGFDLALTEDGLKFPEINRFPDYPAIEKYSPATIDYLLYKLDVKKKRYGYDVSGGHKLVKLPKR